MPKLHRDRTASHHAAPPAPPTDPELVERPDGVRVLVGEHGPELDVPPPAAEPVPDVPPPAPAAPARSRKRAPRG